MAHAATRMFQTRIGAVAVVLALALLAPAQDQADRIEYTKQTYFRIPFQAEQGANRLKHVELWVSTDDGRNWRWLDSAAPDRQGFTFRAERDGIYWFTVRTVDLEGRAFPTNLEGTRPQLRVCVDTQPPTVALRPTVGSNGVEWDLRDDHLDLGSFRMDYRPPGGADWLPLNVEPAVTGQKTWNAGAAAIGEIRLRVTDKAGNASERRTTLAMGGMENRNWPPGGGGGGAAAPQNAPAVQLVNSNRISLNYRIEDRGPSETTLELWYTRDQGRSWQKHPEPMPAQPPCVFQAPQEGQYGFTLVARNAVGRGDTPPRPGDLPQVWVEVDQKPPLVKLGAVEVGRDFNANKMTISWQSSDKNPAPHPVKLLYSADRNGQWKDIAANLDATGRYTWEVPGDGISYYIRVEAVDRAGNTGTDETQKPIIVDLSRPRGVILGVEPVKQP